MKPVAVLIIGAGAAGLMCAIEAGKRGRSVMVLDHANKPGKKILMSGGGRCNFTNLHVGPENFISHNPHFCKSALRRYTPYDFIGLVKKHRIPFHEKTLGQLFCDHKSSDILNMLLTECADVSAHIHLNVTIKKINRNNIAGFQVETSLGVIACDSLVIATGGLSIPTMGASPFGYKVAEQFGMNVYPVRAGLVPLTLHQQDKQRLASLSGISLPCLVECQGEQFKEAMLFTHRGLSGPAMLQISSYWCSGDYLTIQLIPDVDLLADLKTLQQASPKLTIKNALTHFLPKAVVDLWLSDDVLQSKLADCSHQTLKTVADSFQRWCIQPNGTEGYRTAEVTIGGVDCHGISSKTFQANNVPGLYFIGEVLDVTGWLGGYNFQWAWASGVAAGQVV